MIISIARVSIEEAKHDHLFAAWSNMVALDHPPGLVECLLTKTEEQIEVVGLWQDRNAHDAAVATEGSHPAYRIFDATGTPAEHEVVDVIGHIIVSP